MATWRRRDLERKHAERNVRMARALRPELLIAVVALVAAGVALWQAMAAQSRAELLAHDLSVADARLRNHAYAPAAPAASGTATASPGVEPPLPPLPTMNGPADANDRR